VVAPQKKAVRRVNSAEIERELSSFLFFEATNILFLGTHNEILERKNYRKSIRAL
jgi:hypothetical protein